MLPSSSSLYCRHCGAANAAGSELCFACQQPLSGEQEPEEVLLKERYRVLAQVGTGGFGAVYRAVDSQSGTVVAIKQVNLQGLLPQEVIEATDAFNREVRLLSGLKHPHLPAISDTFTDAEHWYIVMDYIEGETLEAYLKQKFAASASNGLPLDESLALAVQLCTVLDYLHTRQPPIIFRDLKPANIMRTPDGQLYLIDFGIARHFIPGKPKDTIPFGSPGYAAPEQYGRAQTTPQADIYSLGALLHQLLSAADPAESPFHFAPLRLYGPAELATLDALIQRMVQVDASQRPANIAEVKDILQGLSDALAKSEPRLWQPPAEPLSLPAGYRDYRQWDVASDTGAGQQQQQHAPVSVARTSRRNVLLKGLAWGSVGVLGSVGVGAFCRAALAFRHFSGVMANPQSPAAAPTPNYVFSDHTRAVTTLAWSPNGEYIASGSADQRVLVWRAADGVLLYTFYGYTSAVTSVTWSSDTMCIASCGNTDGTIQIWEAMNGNQPTSFHEHRGKALALAWASNKEMIASGGEDRNVRVWDADNGRLAFKFTGHSGSVRYLAWMPPGVFPLASASADGTVRIWMFPPSQASSFIAVYRGHRGPVNALAWSPDRTMIASTSDDGTVQVWRVTNGKLVFTYRGHTGKVNAVAWLLTPDGKPLIASGGEDSILRTWDFSGMQGSFSPFPRILSLATNPFNRYDGRVAVGCQDGTVQMVSVV